MHQRQLAAAFTTLLVGGAARAQEPAAIGEAGDRSETGTPTAPVVFHPYAEGHRWFPLGGLREPVDAVAAGNLGEVLAMDADGGIHRLRGASFGRVLPPLLTGDPADIDPEELLLQAETAAGELGESSGGGVDPGDSEDGGSGAFESPEVDGVELGVLEVELQRDGSGRPPLALWGSRRRDGLVLASRADGAWRSTDGGHAWTPVGTLPPTFAFAEPWSGDDLVVAGTTDGLRHSPDGGRTWLQVDDALSGIAVYDLTSEDGQIWAATEWGLFHSPDGLRWEPVRTRGREGRPVQRVVADPAWPEGLWVITDEGVLRSDDGGRTVRAVGQTQLPGASELVALGDRVGHLLALSTDGVWESVDGGVQWHPVVVGLQDPDIRALIDTPVGPLVGTGRGVYRLERAAPEAQAPVVALPPERTPPLGEVVDVALRRTGVSMEPLLLRRATMVTRFLPRLRVWGVAERDHNLSVTLDEVQLTGSPHRLGETDEDFDTNYWVGLDLCFGGCVAVAASAFTDFSDYADYTYDYADYGYDADEIADAGYDAADLAADLYVVGDEIYLYDEAGGYSPAAANVAARMAERRTDMANVVAEIYLSRRRLVTERAAATGLPLGEQIALDLEIDELTARLDVFTDGYFSRALEGT